ncbi:hypothetical protein [Nocardiopsis sp. LOL_012]|uniref:hypothetical protein n=1 Tax=Nocardiopsis sp. LOL_012 TaxID=3345409 RepID=UPI003A888014
MDVVSDEGIPLWFLCLMDDSIAASESIPEESREGAARYFDSRGGREWDIQEWLFMFDPELRSWSWWDLVECKSQDVLLFFDSNGEVPVPCEELWWSIFSSGALAVSDPFLVSSDFWVERSSFWGY